MSKRKIRELIEENFTPKEIFNDNEEEFTVGSSVNILDDNIEQFPTNLGRGVFAFKSKIFPGDVSESTVSKHPKVKDFFDSPEHSSSEEDRDEGIDDNTDADSMSQEIDSVASEHDSTDDGDTNESDVDDEADDDEESNSNVDESDIEDDMDENADLEDVADKKAAEVDLSEVFSKKTLDKTSEIRKATVVTSQLGLWNILLRSRIVLQESIAASNELRSDQISAQSPPEKIESIACLEEYLAKLVELQEKLRREATQQKNIGEEDYAKFRNNIIETWYKRTRSAKANFSAFEAPLLKQMEKPDLIKKTYRERTESSETSDETVLVDTQTIADEEYYHKLLRLFVERETANISDSSQLGRQLMKLHDLRKKMKRKIDTRRTKGRKIKFDPHTKLINFMAPQTLHRWEEKSINELFGSIFGKKTLNFV